MSTTRNSITDIHMYDNDSISNEENCSSNAHVTPSVPVPAGSAGKGARLKSGRLGDPFPAEPNDAIAIIAHDALYVVKPRAYSHDAFNKVLLVLILDSIREGLETVLEHRGPHTAVLPGLRGPEAAWERFLRPGAAEDPGGRPAEIFALGENRGKNDSISECSV
eukprot:scaffold301198_cov37-Prasinocladus_malaysianus.AAC.1